MFKIPPIPFSGGKQPQQTGEDWNAYAAELYPPTTPVPIAKPPAVLVTIFNGNSLKIDIAGQPTVYLQHDDIHQALEQLSNQAFELAKLTL